MVKKTHTVYPGSAPLEEVKTYSCLDWIISLGEVYSTRVERRLEVEED